MQSGTSSSQGCCSGASSPWSRSGLSLQYGVARVLNVAHGEFIMMGAFVTFWLFGSVNLNPLVSIVVTALL